MKLRIDPTRCQAYGSCVDHVPEAVELDEWGHARVLGDGELNDPVAGRRAITDCPACAVLEAG